MEGENQGAKAVSDFFMSSELKAEDLKSYLETKKQYDALKTELETLQPILDHKEEYILRVCKGMEAAKAGKFAAWFKEQAGKSTTKYKELCDHYRKYIKALIGDIKDEDWNKYGKPLSEYTTKGDPKQVIDKVVEM
jgi:hypothetical protein